MADTEPRDHSPAPAGFGYGRFDLWRDIATADAPEVRELAALLELRARDPDQAAARTAYLPSASP